MEKRDSLRRSATGFQAKTASRGPTRKWYQLQALPAVFAKNDLVAGTFLSLCRVQTARAPSNLADSRASAAYCPLIQKTEDHNVSGLKITRLCEICNIVKWAHGLLPSWREPGLFGPGRQLTPPPMTDLENASKARRIAVHQIRQLMEFWNIAPEELGQPRSVPKVPRHVAPPGYVKYRHPVTGETWDGDGDHPEWLRKALLKEGYRVAELKPEHQQEPQAIVVSQPEAGHAG